MPGRRSRRHRGAVREPGEERRPVLAPVEEKPFAGARFASPPLPVHPAAVRVVDAVRLAALGVLVAEIAVDGIAAGAESGRAFAGGVPAEARLGAGDELEAHG